MRKTVLGFIASFMVLSAHAQDLKIKKGEVLLDGTAVALVKEEKRVCELSTPDGKKVFTFFITNRTKQGVSTPEDWLQFTSPEGAVFELQNPKDRIVLSNTKYFVYKLLDSKPQLIAGSGINQSAIADLFGQGSRPFSAKWDSIYTVVKNMEKADEDFTAQHPFSINDNGDIIINKEVVGKVLVNDPSLGKRNYYIKDRVGNQVAEIRLESWSSSENFSNITTCDDRKLPFLQYKTAPQLSENEMVRRMVSKLLANGYALGDMTENIKLRLANKAKAEEQQAADEERQLVKETREASVNIYNVPGKVVLADGTTHEGSITIVYESIEKKMGKGTSGILDLDAPAMGSAVTLTHNDANGKTEQKFKAADNVTVYAGGKTYIGVKGSKDGVLTNAGGSGSINIGTRHPQFFEVRFTDGKGNYILEHPLAKDELYLKLKDRKEAIYLGDKAMLGTRSAKTRTKLTAEYLNRPDMDASKYDTRTLEGLRQLIADYDAAGSK